MSASVTVTVDVCGLRLRAALKGTSVLVDEQMPSGAWVRQLNCYWVEETAHGPAHLLVESGPTLGRGAADHEECLQAIDRALRDALRRAA